jgi:hypothetical protein
VVYNLQVSAALSSFGLVAIVAVAVTVLPGYWVVRVPAGLVSPAYQ